MKLKHLESALSSVTREFPTPKVELEQYPTSAHLAAWVGLTALENDDIGEGRSCLDLGTGTGMLAICCALLETDHVIAVDCDEKALVVARENVEKLELDDTIEFVLGKVKLPTINTKGEQEWNRHAECDKRGRGRGRGGRGRTSSRGQKQHASSTPMPPLNASSGAGDDGVPLRGKCVDTVLTNPPFGTKQNAGMDVQFLRAAIRLARRAVYSFHKTSTRDYLIRTIGDQWGFEVKVVAQMKFDIPNMYKFHQKKSVDVEVDLIRVGILTTADSDDGSDS